MSNHNYPNWQENSLIKYLSLLAILLLHLQASAAISNTGTSQPQLVTYSDDEHELTASCYIANSNEILVFFPSVYASLEDQEAYASEIAAGGLATCISHMLTDLFLPMKNSSYAEVPRAAMLGLLNLVRQQTGKQIYLVAHGSGNRLAYRLATLAFDNSRATLQGLIMLSPNLLDHTPEPGEQPVYMPEVHRKTLPLYIFQPEYSPHHYHLEALLKNIRESGTSVYFQRIANARDGYALRENRSAREQRLREQGATLFLEAIRELKYEP